MRKFKPNKMEKLITISQEYLIVCDNSACDYKVDNDSDQWDVALSQYIDVACPDCGENLLTIKDYTDGIRLLAVINWINKWFSWITFFCRSGKRTSVDVHVHNGVHIGPND